MSIQSEITRIRGNLSDAFTAITNKGVTVPAGSTSDDLADLISQISGGGGGTGAVIDQVETLPGGGAHHIITGVDISGDTVTAAHLEEGYTAHDAEGNAIVGTLQTDTPITYRELATFTGSTSTMVSLSANVSTFDLVSIQVFASDGTTIVSNVLMPRPLLAGVTVKAYGESSSQWGSFALQSDNVRATFNRTTANTSKVVVYGINL